MDDTGGQACSPPTHILGYTIRSRTRIYVSYLLPVVLELAVYIVQITADCAVSYQHFKTNQPDFGWATLVLILVPPVLTFALVVTSSSKQCQTADANYKSRCEFVSYQLLQMLLFPFVVVYRLALRLFWSIEALFHDDDDDERMRCLAKATQCSTGELYLFIVAYGQSAPQIILQLYHMLTQDLFRNYDTTTVQAISLVFSAIDLAAITTAYQRFESQKQVGRHYPWSPPECVQAQKQLLECDKRLREECERKKRDSERTIASFPESDKIMENFKLRYSSPAADTTKSPTFVSEPKTHEGKVEGFDEVDTEAENKEEEQPTETTVLLHSPPKSLKNATDDDKVKIAPMSRFHSIREEIPNMDAIDLIDTVPDSPAPLPPTQTPALILPSATATTTPPTSPPILLRPDATNTNTPKNKRSSKRMSQLETFKDMLLVNAQLYIKENVPRPPKILINRVNQPDDEDVLVPITPTKGPDRTPITTPLTPKDVTDFFMPRPTRIINGIQQDDFAGKTIAFFGWIAFITMRMLSLATFCVFYPKAFFIVVGVHYLVMLVALWTESRFKGKLNRSLFYVLLAYVYVFVILEFRVAFKRVRLWIVLYFLITMGENLTMTLVWYTRAEFESWWFQFIFESIIYSGLLFMTSLIVYYCILKPKSVTLIVEDNLNRDSTNKIE